MLVTGGAGFIGSNFVHYTLDHRPQYEITVLDALTYAGNKKNLAPCIDRIRFVHGNICDGTWCSPLVDDTDVVVHFAAESHNDNSLDNPWPFINTNFIGTYVLLEAVAQTSQALPSHLHRRGVRRPRAGRIAQVRRADGLQPLEPVLGGQGGIRPPGPRLGAVVRRPGDHHQLRQQLRALPALEKMIPRQVTNVLIGRKPRLYGAGVNVREWTHVDDHNEAVHLVLEKGPHRRDLPDRLRRRAQQPRNRRR